MPQTEAQFWRKTYRWLELVAVFMLLFVLLSGWLAWRADQRSAMNADRLSRIEQRIEQCLDKHEAR